MQSKKDDTEKELRIYAELKLNKLFFRASMLDKIDHTGVKNKPVIQKEKNMVAKLD